jgi:hypothetical protein
MVVLALAVAAIAFPGAGLAERGGVNQIVRTYTLADRSLADFQNAALPGSVATDRGIRMGSIGSDLWRSDGDHPNEYWMLSDRGPTGLVAVGGVNRRTFPVPDYTPMILHVRTEGGEIRVQETLPLVGQSGKPVSGLPNLAGRDETPFDYSGQVKLAFNPSGLDPEGLVRTSDGVFWLIEEYGPSIVKVDDSGRVLKRFVPAGLALAGADYPVEASLPAIYAKRKGNRGFEGIALSKDERTLYVVLQSPLSNPNKTVGDASRNTRVLAFDLKTERVTAEYVYRFEPATEFSPSAVPADMKLSAVVALNPTTLLIDERTDDVARLYAVDLSKATNILGSKWDSAATSPSLEALADPAAAGIAVLPKSLVVDLSTLPDMPQKIEGIAVIDHNTIAIANDNDFSLDAGDNLVDPPVKSRLLVIRLATPLPCGASHERAGCQAPARPGRGEE